MPALEKSTSREPEERQAEATLAWSYFGLKDAAEVQGARRARRATLGYKDADAADAPRAGRGRGGDQVADGAREVDRGDGRAGFALQWLARTALLLLWSLVAWGALLLLADARRRRRRGPPARPSRGSCPPRGASVWAWLNALSVGLALASGSSWGSWPGAARGTAEG